MCILVTDAHGIWPNVWGLNWHVFRGKRPARNLPRSSMIYVLLQRVHSAYSSNKHVLFVAGNVIHGYEYTH